MRSIPNHLTVKQRKVPKPRKLTQAPGRRNVRHVKSFTEAVYEKLFARALAATGQFSYHTAERFYLGIPDRYVAGGRWIEFKQIKWAGTRPVSPIRQFTGPQIKTLDKFTAVGDDCWVAIVFQTTDGELRTCFMSWPRFRNMKPQWTPAMVYEFTWAWEGGAGRLKDQITAEGFNNAQG